MKTLFLIVLMLFVAKAEYIIYDFNSSETSGTWYAVNDGVMGGVSESNIVTNIDGTATFSGVLSPDNNGGFASVRSLVEDKLDDSFEGVTVRVKGDGNKYMVRFRTNISFDGYAYQARVQTEKNKWKEYKIPFKDFKPTFRGYILDNKPDLQSENIVQIGLMIADKQFGFFTMDIDWIKFY